MAAIQKRGDSSRLLFRHGGRQHAVPLGRVTAAEANIVLNQADALLARLAAGLTVLPDGVAVADFVHANGHARPAAVPPASPAPARLTLGQLRDRYLATHAGSLEANTLAGARTHFKHFVESWGERLPLESLGVADLQAHADRRRLMLTRDKKPVSAVTVKKDFIALRAARNWAVALDFLAAPFPKLKAVRFGKAEEKFPFMTYAEVAARVAQGGDPEKLWECLYLQPAELAELLAHVRSRANAPAWLYPMACVAAYTGVRRSEILRAEVGDLDLAEMALTVREKKRKKGTATTRRVPVAGPLAAALADWLPRRPGGTPFLFCEAGTRPRSRVRGKTTGNAAGGHGRGPAVVARDAPAPAAVTPHAASDHLDRALAASGKWARLRGWHVLRHSFISACANTGVDQRMIDAWVGHSTDEQRRRYRHLYPSTQRDEIKRVFG